MIQWAKFWMLGMIWGSSFLLIKIAVEHLGALPLVSMRLGIAALFFLGFLWVTGRAFPRANKDRAALIFVGVFNTAIPFTLISWGETQIDSGLATILNGTVPLFTLVFAHFLLVNERLNIAKIFGMVLGFVGVVVLTSESLGNGDSTLPGQLAVLLAASSYATAIVTLRARLHHIEALTIAGWSIVVGAMTIIPITLVFSPTLPTPADVDIGIMLAAATLALVNTVVAYFLFYDLLYTWGARATLVTYAMPPIGVTLGVVVLGEVLDWRLIVGGGLILTGIILTKSSDMRAMLGTVGRIPSQMVIFLGRRQQQVK
jgi:drug/metabolite transporter (DMT)-like permease